MGCLAANAGEKHHQGGDIRCQGEHITLSCQPACLHLFIPSLHPSISRPSITHCPHFFPKPLCPHTSPALSRFSHLPSLTPHLPSHVSDEPNNPQGDDAAPAAAAAGASIAPPGRFLLLAGRLLPLIKDRVGAQEASLWLQVCADLLIGGSV